jgi:hypothetical protein
MSGNRLIGILVMGAVFFSSGCSLSDEPLRDDSGAVVSEGTLDVFSLSVGDCLKTLEANEDGDFDESTAVPCSEPHIYEVFYDFSVENATLEAIQVEADNECLVRYETFIGLAFPLSTIVYTTLVPTTESYSQGDRAVSCLAHLEDLEPVTGSLRGAGPDYPQDFPATYEAGDCLAYPLDDEIGDPSDLVLVPCDEPHTFEVYYRSLEIEYFLDDFAAQVDATCQAGFEKFVNIAYENSQWYFSYFIPTESSYLQGDREIICVLHEENYSPIMGTLQGAEE